MPNFKPEIKRTLSNLNTRTGVKKPHFQYWADGLDIDWNLDENKFESKSQFHMEKIMHLAGLRRATANFVRILTGDEKIQVKYSSGKDSYTDGEIVVISAEDNPNKFDKTVALALHEASHCLLTDFDFANLAFKTNRSAFFPAKWFQDASCTEIRQDILSQAMMIMNVIEDRKIDEFIYRTAVGYRPYYNVLYKDYWNARETAKALRFKPEWRIPTVEAYLSRIINISNPAAWETRQALPGIEEIYKIINLPNISRLNNEPNTYRTFVEDQLVYGRKGASNHLKKVSNWSSVPEHWKSTVNFVSKILDDRRPEIFCMTLKILDIIHDNIDNTLKSNAATAGTGTTGDSRENPQSGKSSDSENNQSGTSSEWDTGTLSNLDIGNEQMSNASASSGDTEAENNTSERTSDSNTPASPAARRRMTKAERDSTINEKRLQKEQEKILRWTNGDIRKKKLDKNLQKDVDAMESAGASIHQVGNEKIGHGQVIVTNEINDNLLAADWFMFGRNYCGGGIQPPSSENEKSIVIGIRMGQILTHRIQVRNEQTMMKFPNQVRGKIDRRTLARLGMGIETVFSRLTQDEFQPALIHLSLDASGSMAGDKWQNTIVVATALAYAATKIGNLDVVISLRGGVGSENIAHLAIIHDSRKNSFSHFRKYMSRLYASGGTPEGLCFEAIMEELLVEAQKYSMYFVNISDGEPSFHCSAVGSRTARKYRRNPLILAENTDKRILYCGEVAWTHTRHQVNKMREAGIKVLSYFVTTQKYGSYAYYSFRENSPDKIFRVMYGDDAVFIDVTKVVGIIATLNKLLLKKN